MWHPWALLGTIWGFVGLTLIFVSIRLYVRLTTVRRPYREILVVLAWILFLLFAVGMTILYYRYHFYRQITDLTTPPSEYLTPHELENFWKLFFMLDFTFPQLLNFCKAVLLLTYLDLCPRHIFPKIWWLIMFTWFMVIGHEIAIFFIYEFLQCYPDPVSYLWSATEICWGRYPGFLATEWSVALATDILCYIIPIFIVYELQNLTLIQRIGVASMFCIGFIHAAFTAWYVYEAFAPIYLTPTPTSAFRVQLVQIMIPASAIIVVCIPQLRLLGRWTFIRSFVITLSTTINEIGSKTGLGTTSTRKTLTAMDVTGQGEKEKLEDEEKSVPAVVNPVEEATDIESPRSPELAAPIATSDVR